jgi:hypothetical protein
VLQLLGPGTTSMSVSVPLSDAVLVVVSLVGGIT